MSTEKGIDYFGRSHPVTRFQEKASLRIRRRLYEWFRDSIGGVRGKMIMDHGSTPDTNRADSNCIIGWLLDDGASVAATSPEDIAHLPQSFPGLRIVRWPPTITEFGGVISAVLSSAVIEHVGNHDAQVNYISELLRLSDSVLLTTPNRAHWLEFHTKLPLIHKLPKNIHRKLLAALGMTFWSQEANLNLLNRADLESMLGTIARCTERPLRLRWHEPRFLGQISNLVTLIEITR